MKASLVVATLLTSVFLLTVQAANAASPQSAKASPESTSSLTPTHSDNVSDAPAIAPDSAAAAPENVVPAHVSGVGVGAVVDNFLGFYIHFVGSYALTKHVDAMLVGTIFTATQFGTNGASTKDEEGNVTPASNNAIGLFVPVGPAVRFRLFDNSLQLTPFIEIANGGLLSGQRNDLDATHHTGSFAEGLVPGLSVHTQFGAISAELKGAYFFPVQHLGPYRLQLVRVSANVGYSLLNWVDLGVMYDWLSVVKKTDVADFEPYDDFMFLGPQLDFHFTKHAGISFAAGADLGRPPVGVANEGRSFYRAGVHMKF